MKKYFQSIAEEKFNTFSHLLGAFFAVYVTFYFCSILDFGIKYSSCLVYSVTLFLMFISSTLYHHQTNHQRKELFQRFDHCCIYLLIAGSTTPFALINIQGIIGWVVFGSMWSLAIIGIVYKLFTKELLSSFGMYTYVVMSWAPIIGAKYFLEKIPNIGLIYLIIGGVFYLTGVYFYQKEKMHFNHFVWHLFVLAGAFNHFLAIKYSI